MMRLSKSNKIDPPGYCVAISHDVDEFEYINQASKSDIMKVRLITLNKQ